MAKARKMSDIDKGEIITLFHKKCSTQKIAVVVGFSQSSVDNILKEFQATGSTARKRSSGKPRKITSAEDRLVRRFCLRDHFKSSSDIEKELKDAIGAEIDTSTVRFELRLGGFHGRRPAKKSFLNGRIRTAIFSYESRFDSFGSDRIHHVWRRSGERYSGKCVQITVRQLVSRMIWGCFSFYGMKALSLVYGKVNGATYKRIIEEHLIP